MHYLELFLFCFFKEFEGLMLTKPDQTGQTYVQFHVKIFSPFLFFKFLIFPLQDFPFQPVSQMHLNLYTVRPFRNFLLGIFFKFPLIQSFAFARPLDLRFFKTSLI